MSHRDVLPPILPSPRAGPPQDRATRQGPSVSRPNFHPGETVGVYEHGKEGVVGGSMAQVVCENTEKCTVTIQLRSGEQKDVLASSVFNHKMMWLVNGMRVQKNAPQLPKVPQNKSPRSFQRSALTFHTARIGRTQTGLSGFSHGRRTSAETMGEVHLLLSRPDAPSGPAGDAKGFKNALLKKFGKFEYAWEDMDLNRDDRLDFNEFTRACRHMQFGGNLKQIFEELAHGEETIRPESLDNHLPDKLTQMHTHQGRTPRRPSIEPPSDGRPNFINERRGSATMGEMHLLLNRPDARTGPPSDVKMFKHALVKKFGSLDQAWDEIDVNAHGSVDFQGFTRACRRMQFDGNLVQIYKELTNGEEVLRPELLGARSTVGLPPMQSNPQNGARRTSVSRDPASGLFSKDQALDGADFDHGHCTNAETFGEVQQLLKRPEARAGPPQDAKSFRGAMLKRFGNFRSAWDAIDRDGHGRLQYQEFVRACRSIQFDGNFKKIFDELTGAEAHLRLEHLEASTSDHSPRP